MPLVRRPRSWSMPLVLSLRSTGPLLSVKLPQFLLGLPQHLFSARGEVFSGAIDVKSEHRHRRSIRRALATLACFRRAFQGSRDAARILPRKNSPIEVECVAMLGDRTRPARAFSSAMLTGRFWHFFPVRRVVSICVLWSGTCGQFLPSAIAEAMSRYLQQLQREETCQNRRPSSEQERMLARESHPQLRRANSYVRRCTTFAKASTGRGPRSRPLRLDCPKRDARV